MKSTISALLVLALSVFAGSTQAAPQSKPILENVFTLELKFGDKDVPDEYLLVRPLNLAVANNGDVIVPDEYKLKVFDTDGKPKKIIGRRGQGPGEFTAPSPTVFVTENGTICARDVSLFNIFDAQYKFIYSTNHRNDPDFKQFAEEKGFQWFIIDRIIPYDKDEMFVIAHNEQPINLPITSQSKNCNLLLYKKETELYSITESPDETFSNDGKISFTIPEKGSLFSVELPGQILAFTDRGKDRVLENGKWYYLIYTYDLKTRQKKVFIKREYAPVAFPDSVLHPEHTKGYKGDDIFGSMQTPYTRKEMDQKRTEILEKLKYYPAVNKIFYDKNIVFVKTYQYAKDKGTVVELFDSQTGVYLKSAFFPYDLNVKNGKSYRLLRPVGEFPYIEKYHINPVLYQR
jgi:hypothetical protein